METTLPKKTVGNITFFPVPVVTEVEMIFGVPEDKFIAYRDIPKVPREYERIASELFFKGGNLPLFSERVDRLAAHNAIVAWLRSFAPKHEAKIATVAYALWLWSNDKALS